MNGGGGVTFKKKMKKISLGLNCNLLFPRMESLALLVLGGDRNLGVFMSLN